MKSKFDDADFRHAFVEANVKRGIAYQLRALRNAEQMNQTQFGELIGKPQSVICRLENPHYGKVTVQTLIEIANDLDVGLIVKFVTHDRVLKEVNQLSQEELAPVCYEKSKSQASRRQPDATPVYSVGWSETTGENLIIGAADANYIAVPGLPTVLLSTSDRIIRPNATIEKTAGTPTATRRMVHA